MTTSSLCVPDVLERCWEFGNTLKFLHFAMVWDQRHLLTTLLS